MCANTGLTMFLCMALGGTAAPRNLPPEYDHYHPERLNWQAVQKLREGDAKAAQVLLERAVLLAPHDKTLAGNLEEVRAFRQKPVALTLSVQPPPPAAASPPTTPSASLPVTPPGQPVVEPGIPAIWPAR